MRLWQILLHSSRQAAWPGPLIGPAPQYLLSPQPPPNHALPAPGLHGRRNACAAVYYSGSTAFTLVNLLGRMLAILHLHGGGLGRWMWKALMQPELMGPLADAVRGVVSVSTLLSGGPDTANVRQLNAPLYDLGYSTGYLMSLVSMCVTSVCQYTDVVACELLYQATSVSQQAASSSHPGVSPAAGTPSASLSQDVATLAGSELLAAAAVAVVDSPNVFAFTAFNGEGSCDSWREASDVAKALCKLNLVRGHLGDRGGPEGRRLANVLLRAMRHVAVRRLQVALLDQLAAEAGLGVGLEEPGAAAEELGQGQQGGQRDGGWSDSIGSWWFAQEEARRGRLLGCPDVAGGVQDGAKAARLLEEHHVHVLGATVVEWSAATRGLQPLSDWSGAGVGAGPGAGADAATAAEAEARVAGPSPLLAARLTVRAMEALCRLCRGEGLGGAYAPAPEWLLAKALVGNAWEAGPLQTWPMRCCVPTKPRCPCLP